MALHFTYSELPPTSNKIYFRGTILTKVAREYAERFSYHVTREHLAAISQMDQNALYELHLHFYFETVLNETYNNPKVKPSKRAKTRYKKFDLNNRIKLIEDCIRDALGIDDSHTFESHHKKMQDPLRPRVEVYVNAVNPAWYGIPPEEPMK